MTRTVAVVTDSAASLPPALANAWGIDVVPLQIIVDDVARAETPDVGAGGVLADLEAGRQVATSQPSPEAFVEVFERATQAGASHVVAVLISGGLSGTVNAAHAAATRVQVPVSIVDSRTLAMACGFAAIAAAMVARDGGSPERVVQEAQRVAGSSLCVFTVDTLEYLRRGGRISPTVAALGRALSVRPVLAIEDGEVALAERVRTTAKARAALVARVHAHASPMAHPAVALMTLGDSAYGHDAAGQLEARLPHLGTMVRAPVSAVLAAHAGPGVLAGVVADLPVAAASPPP